jgi:hypothetical protein
VYESGLFSFRNSKRSLHLVKFLFNNNKYFSKFFNWIQVAIHSGYDIHNCISVAIYVSFTDRNKNRHIIKIRKSETRRNSAKASRQELIIRCDIRLFSLKTELYNLSDISGVMGSFFSIGVTNRRFAPSNTFLAIRLLVGDVFPNSMRPV